MKSSELAAQAGVTVRTLRHYHQVGVLPEPPRSHNGYREYTIRDLIRLLRIKRLSGIGIPLEAMTDVLDSDDDPATLLDAVELDIDSQLARLQRQKDLIFRLRQQRTALDLPPELAGFVATFASATLSPAMSQKDREQTILLAHLAGEDNLDALVTVFEQLSAPEVLDSAVQFNRDFAALADDADVHQINTLVDTLVAAFAPLVRELSHSTVQVLSDEAAAQRLFDEYQRSEFNSAQQLVIAQMSERIHSV